MSKKDWMQLNAYRDTGLRPGQVLAVKKRLHDLEQAGPCGLCKYAPAEIGNGKPCATCPAGRQHQTEGGAADGNQ